LNQVHPKYKPETSPLHHLAYSILKFSVRGGDDDNNDDNVAVDGAVAIAITAATMSLNWASSLNAGVHKFFKNKEQFQNCRHHKSDIKQSSILKTHRY
jgi:hypothetical protein